jgi:hypothetical protein
MQFYATKDAYMVLESKAEEQKKRKRKVLDYRYKRHIPLQRDYAYLLITA